MGWFSRLLGGQDRAAAADSKKPAAAPAAPAPGSTAGAESSAASMPAAALGPPLLFWLLGADDAQAPPAPQAVERQAISVADQLLAQASLPRELLPRAANVVPQLLALLRQQDLPVPVLAERIGRDPVLAAEVLRQAGGAFFAHLGPVADLPQAIQRLGTEGLQMAIARVVLRPMFQAAPDSLSARTATRLWEHADGLSQHAAQAARQAGLPAFDGYLVGLLHDTGWTVLFHALQRAGIVGLEPVSVAGADALAERAHRLFGLAAAPWEITPGFAAFAADAQKRTLALSSHPLAAVLRAAEGPCMTELQGGG